MNKLFFLSALVLPLGASAQSAPPKGSNIIYITLPDSASAGWKRVSDAIASQGFSVKASDAQLLTISTDVKELNPNMGVAVSCHVKGRVATLRGTFANKILETQAMPVVFLGKQKGTYAVAWQKLQAVAAAMGGTVSYGKE